MYLPVLSPLPLVAIVAIGYRVGTTLVATFPVIRDITYKHTCEILSIRNEAAGERPCLGRAWDRDQQRCSTAREQYYSPRPRRCSTCREPLSRGRGSGPPPPAPEQCCCASLLRGREAYTHPAPTCCSGRRRSRTRGRRRIGTCDVCMEASARLPHVCVCVCAATCMCAP